MTNYGDLTGIVHFFGWGTSELGFEWRGGNRIGISYERLMDCDRDIIKFRGDLPKPGDRIEVGPFSVIAVEWRGASVAPFLVCDKIDSGEE